MRPAAIDTDSDWTARTEPTTFAERVRNALAADPGCYRTDVPPDPAMPFARLIDAVCEPPTDIESVVLNSAGQCLAHTTGEDDAGCANWVLTAIGKARVAREAIRHDADAILRTLLPEFSDDREDFADECAREARREVGS